MTTNRIFIDLDGVLADFEQGYLDNFGHAHNSVNQFLMWRNITSKEDHWQTLPRMAQFETLWGYVNQFNPIVLTGCPRSGYNAAVEGKKLWCSEHLGDNIEVITCFSRHKPKHMITAGDILIDDLEKNCDRWTEAGGVALRYTGDNAGEIINKLGDLGFRS